VAAPTRVACDTHSLQAFGGTNWGNLGYPRGYTSYDYGATIAEDRTITRKKYGEAKPLGYFFSSVPAYREAVPRRATTALTATADLTVTPLSANETGFWVLRHTDYSQRKKSEYEITLPTRRGNITIPQLVEKLTLNGRDSKIICYSSIFLNGLGLMASGVKNVLIFFSD
jgi:hypothetical protein